MGVNDSKLKPADLAELHQQTEFSLEEIKEWYHGFRKDYPKGYITEEEFKQVYKQFYPEADDASFAAQTFRLFDTNRDDKIDFREFLSGFSVSCRGSHEDKMAWIFELYDLNSNGFVSKDEMLVIVKSVFQIIDYESTGTKIELNRAESCVEKIYQKADRNSDGLLSLDEFVDYGSSDATLCKVFNGIKYCIRY